jgi:hypothetical protein
MVVQLAMNSSHFMKPTVSFLCFWQSASEHYPQPLKSPPKIQNLLLQNPFWYYRSAKPTPSNQVFLPQFNTRFLNLPYQNMNGDSIKMSLKNRDYEQVSQFQMVSDRHRQMCGVRGSYLDECLRTNNKRHVRTNYFPCTSFHFISYALLQKWEDINSLENNLFYPPCTIDKKQPHKIYQLYFSVRNLLKGLRFRKCTG